MNDHNKSDLKNSLDHLVLRRCIMLRLYEIFKEYPYASVELDDLRVDCQSTVKKVNWNIVYLEKKGLVELSPSTDCFPYVACSVSISADGIDLVESADLNSIFPKGS